MLDRELLLLFLYATFEVMARDRVQVGAKTLQGFQSPGGGEMRIYLMVSDVSSSQ